MNQPRERKTISKVKNLFVCAVTVCTAILSCGITASAEQVKTASVSAGAYALSSDTVKLSAPKFAPSRAINTGYTHPFNHQTNQITLHWGAVKGAAKYEIYIYGGKYTKRTLYKTIKGTSCTVTGLTRANRYSFRLKAVNAAGKSEFSNVQTLSTARMDFDSAGWKAMCRIVYHEVGKINESMWDKPIVYVADCVVNRYEQAKYKNHALWAPFYKKYKNIQSIIYYSGGFMSSSQLAKDGANYSNVSDRVKKAVLGAVYGETLYKGIKNDNTVFYWCNRSYKTTSSNIAYQFRIPWGYFNIWRSYWG